MSGYLKKLGTFFGDPSVRFKYNDGRIATIDCESRYRMTAMRYCLYPNATSERAMYETLEYCRGLYNTLLADCWADAIECVRRKSAFETDSEVKRIADGNPEMKRVVYSTCLRDVGRRVCNAMEGCRWNQNGDLEHLPRFKGGREHRYKSFTYRTNQGFVFEGDRTNLSKIGRMKYRGSRPPKGAEPRMCIVNVDAKGRWYAIVIHRIPDIKSGWFCIDGRADTVGYDLGLRNVVTSSEGESVVCPEFLKGPREEVRLQTIMNREEGSPRWERARQSMVVINQDVRLRRKGFFDRLAHDMTDGRMVIVMERLSPRRMKERDGTPAAVRDKYTEANWGYLTTRVGFKAAETGSRLVLVNPRNTSRSFH